MNFGLAAESLGQHVSEPVKRIAGLSKVYR